jgi:hypothetical protein
MQVIGEGAYGIVNLGINKFTEQPRAIKSIYKERFLKAKVERD